MEKTDQNIVQAIIDFNNSALTEFSNHYKEGQKNIDAVYGDHYTDAQKAKISAEGRVPIGLPLLFPKVLALKASEKENRDHIEADPFGKEDELTVELINPLMRHIEMQDKPKKYEFTKSDIYEDCIVPCFGASEIYYETNEYKQKEVFIKQIPYNQLLFDLNFTDFEMTSCRRFQQHWDTYLYDLIDEHPERADEFRKMVDEGYENADKFPQREFVYHYYNDTSEEGNKRITRIRDWQLVNKQMWYLNDIQNKTKYEFITKKEAEEERDKLIAESSSVLQQATQSLEQSIPVGTENGMDKPEDAFIIESESKAVWQYTEIAGDVLIEKPTILEVPDECPITVTFSVFTMGKWFTPVGIMRGSQEFVDRLFQQLDYSIGIDSKGGAEVNVDILANEHNNIDDIKVAYVEGALVFKHGNGQLFDPMKRTGANPQYFQMFEFFFKILEDGFGGRNFQGGQEAGGQQSGRAIAQLLAVAQGLTNNYLDNMRRADLLMGRKLLKWIKKFYDYEFTLAVTGEALQEDVMKTLQENGMYQPALMREGKGWLIYDPSNSKAKPISDTSVVLNLQKVSARTDEKEMTRASYIALGQQGYFIPLESVLDTMPLKATEKAKIIAYDKKIREEQKEMQLQMAKAEQLNRQTENLNKSGEVAAKMLNAEGQQLVNQSIINQPTDQNPAQ